MTAGGPDRFQDRFATETEPPRLLAICFCQRIEYEEMTRQSSLLRLVGRIFVDRLPFVMPPLRVYLAISRGNAPAPSRFDTLLSAPDGKGIFPGDHTVADWGDGIETEADVALPEFPVVMAGAYSFSVAYGGQLLGRRQFYVSSREDSPGTHSS